MYDKVMVEKIESGGVLLAIVVRHGFSSISGTDFVTDESVPFQVGYHRRESGFRYRSHRSLPFTKVGDFMPSKIYYVTKGKIGSDLYDDERKKAAYVELVPGDLIIFIAGGHGVDILEDGSEFIEIKQGPYRGTEKDKVFLE